MCPEPEDPDDTLPIPPPEPPRPPLPKRIGPYRVLEHLGRGGMGEVYLAEERGEIVRKVALKVLRHGMVSKELLGRFETERQILAQLDHPHIAKIYAAETTPEGLPYFAMEYIHGVPVDEYCDEQRLSTRARLELFLQICAAIHHAHDHGILHRDLKPRNVLVSEVDGKPLVKVIDFGVAKPLGGRLSEKTYHTEHGRPVGTPLYMSPEQIDNTRLGVDRRTDVYSLGVLLYQLITGIQPFDLGDTDRITEEEVRRRIRSFDPPRPSARLTSLGERSAELAARRGSSLPSLLRQIRGDLDWITVKCLEKNRVRRYDDVAELQKDVENYLHDRPVQQPSIADRLRRFARGRQRILSGLAAAAILGLALALAAQVFLHARDQVRFERYVRKLGEAQQEIETGDFEAARAALEECPPPLRGWEWAHLVDRADNSRLRVEIPDTVEDLVFDFETGVLAVVSRTQVALVDPLDGEILTTIESLSLDRVRGDPSRRARIRAYEPASRSLAYTIRLGAETQLWVERRPRGGAEIDSEMVGSWAADRGSDLEVQWAAEGRILAWCRLGPGAGSAGPSRGEIWSLGEDRRRLVELGAVEDFALSRDGRWLAVVEEGSVWSTELPPSAPRRLLDSGERISLSDDGRRLAVVGAAGVHVVEVETGSVLHHDPAPPADGERVLLSPVGDRLARFAGSKGRLRAVAEGGTALRLLGSESRLNALCFLSEGEIAGGTQGSILRIWPRRPEVLFESKRLRGDDVGEDGLLAVCVAGEEPAEAGKVFLIDPASGARLAERALSTPVTSILLSGPEDAFYFGGNNGRVAASTFGLSGRRTVAEALVDNPARTPRAPVTSLALHPERELLIAAGAEPGRLREISAWSVDDSLRLKWREESPNQSYSSPTFRSDGRVLAYLRGNQIFFLDKDSSQWSRRESGLGASALRYSPARGLLARGTLDGTVALHDDETEAERRSATGVHRTAVTALAWLGQSDRLASGALDGEVLIWEAGALEILLRLDAGGPVLHLEHCPRREALYVRTPERLVVWRSR